MANVPVAAGAASGRGANPVRPPPAIAAAIQSASARTGVDFKFLVAQAAQESGFRADARASTSSATGLYQFTERTWLQMLREHGEKYGVGRQAARIGEAPDGGPAVSDPQARAELLALRNDPMLSAAMAAEYARSNQAFLSRTVGGPIGPTESYLAHFLGPAGASRLLTALRDNPGRSAADLLPRAAAANQSVFYDRRSGRELSVADVYAWAKSKIADREIAVAEAGAASPAAALPLAPPAAPPRPLAWSAPFRSPGAVVRQALSAIRTGPALASETLLALAGSDPFRWLTGRKT